MTFCQHLATAECWIARDVGPNSPSANFIEKHINNALLAANTECVPHHSSLSTTHTFFYNSFTSYYQINFPLIYLIFPNFTNTTTYSYSQFDCKMNQSTTQSTTRAKIASALGKLASKSRRNNAKAAPCNTEVSLNSIYVLLTVVLRRLISFLFSSLGWARVQGRVMGHDGSGCKCLPFSAENNQLFLTILYLFW